jgi:hypothetical protein
MTPIVAQRKDTPRHMPPRPGLHPHPVPPPPLPHRQEEEEWREKGTPHHPHDQPESPPSPPRPAHRTGALRQRSFPCSSAELR